MSTSYIIKNAEISLEDLKSRCAEFGLALSENCKNDEDSQCLEYEDSYFWAYRNGESVSFTKFGSNDDQGIYHLANMLGGYVLSEHDDGFFDDEIDND